DDPEADEVKHESRHKPPPVVLLCQPDEGADPAHGHRHGEQLDDQDQPPEVGVLERERVGHVHISTRDGEREQRDHPDAPGGDVATGRRLLAYVPVTRGALCPADRPIAPLAMRSIYVAANLGLPPHITACLFDLDGVITQTATVHAQAWKQVVDEVGVAFDPATDYADYVDGKPRLDGVRSVLAAREVPATEELVGRIAARKDQLFMDLIHERGVQTYETSIRYLETARGAGKRMAVVSSSKHTSEVLRAARLDHFFDAQVDGNLAE